MRRRRAGNGGRTMKDWNEAARAGYSALAAADEAARARANAKPNGADSPKGADPDVIDIEAPSQTLETVCAADIKQVPVEWVRKDHLARGKMTLLAGDPSLGKSQIAVDTAARITRGMFWPEGGRAPLGSVVILSAEDSASDTIVPRLDLAGADLGRVHILTAVKADRRYRSFNIQDDLELLGRKLMQLDDVALVSIDPITAYLGSIDSHRTSDVRAVLEPVGQFAEKYRIALLGITHPPKATQAKAMHAFIGSIAFVASARLAFVVTEELETERRLLLPVKNNLGPKAAGIGYRIQSGTSSKGIATSGICWDSLPVTITATEALRASSEGTRRGHTQAEAVEFLEEELADGPKDAQGMKAKADDKGITSRTLARARAKLNIVAEKDGFSGGWQWRLP